MPAMPRTSDKARAVARKVLGSPPNQQNQDRKRDERLDKMDIAEDLNYMRWQ